MRLAIRLSWALCLALSFLLSAEVAARVSDRVHEGIALSAVPDLTYDLTLRDSLGTRGRPNGHFQKWKLNSAGFRSAESVLRPVPGCIRVMTLGSSETFGAAGEAPGKEFPAQLGDSLAKHGCFQVMNAAIVGLAIPGLTQLWNEWAWRFRPDFVVVLANPQFYLGERAPAVPGRVLTPASPPKWWIPRLLGKAHDLFHYPDFIQRRRVQRMLRTATAGRAPAWFFTTVPSERLDQYRHDLDSLLATVRSHGATPILAVHPFRFGATLDTEDHALLDALRIFNPRALPDVMLAFEGASAAVSEELARRESVPTVNLRGEMNGRRELFADAVHYTDVGAGVVAGKIAAVILDVFAHDGITAHR